MSASMARKSLNAQACLATTTSTRTVLVWYFQGIAVFRILPNAILPGQHTPHECILFPVPHTCLLRASMCSCSKLTCNDVIASIGCSESVVPYTSQTQARRELILRAAFPRAQLTHILLVCVRACVLEVPFASSQRTVSLSSVNSGAGKCLIQSNLGEMFL